MGLILFSNEDIFAFLHFLGIFDFLHFFKNVFDEKVFSEDKKEYFFE